MSVLINSLRIVKEGDGIFMQLVHDSLQAGYVLLMIDICDLYIYSYSHIISDDIDACLPHYTNK